MCKIELPSSKSISNRALILAGLSDKPVVLKNLLESDDTRYLRGLLENLGVTFERQDKGETIKVIPPKVLKGQDSDNFIGNAGTAARFGVGLSLVTEGAYTLRGVDRMHERPFADLLGAIETQGIETTYLGQKGFLPVQLSHKLKFSSLSPEASEREDFQVLNSNPPVISISGAISSQFITALLLVAARMPQGLTLEMVGEIPSKPYIEMTLEMLRIWGVMLERDQKTDKLTQEPSEYMRIKPGMKAPSHYRIPSDMSAASVPLALGKMLGEDWSLDYEPGQTLQGDEAFAGLVEPLSSSPDGERILDFTTCPDVSMTGMVLAAVSSGTTRFVGLESLRVKECDRIEAMSAGLTALGFEVSVEGDEVVIVGNPNLKPPLSKGKDSKISESGGLGFKINTYEDHRIAFCFGILLYRLGMSDVREIQSCLIHPECVSKTWPDFWLDLASWTFQLRSVSGAIVKRPLGKGDHSQSGVTYLLVAKPRKEHAWQLPQGGVDAGENSLQAAKRELREECGTALSVKWMGERSVADYRYLFPEGFTRYQSPRTDSANGGSSSGPVCNKEAHSFTGAHVSFFTAEYIEGEVMVDGEEIIDYRWATREEIKDLVDPDYWEAIKDSL